MPAWQDKLFSEMALNANGACNFFCLAANRLIEAGGQFIE